MVSCQVTERLYLSESGFVRHSIEIDFTEVLKMKPEFDPGDSLLFPKEFAIDTIFSLSDFHNYEISQGEKLTNEELELFALFDQTKVEMKVNENEGKYIFITEASNVEELNAYMSRLYTKVKEVNAKNEGAKLDYIEGMEHLSLLNFEYGDDYFVKKTLDKIDNSVVGSNDSLVINMDQFDTLGSEENLNSDDNLTVDIDEFMESISLLIVYKQEYYFPKKINEVSLEGAIIGEDEQSFSIELPYMDFAEEPQKFDFQVNFK